MDSTPTSSPSPSPVPGFRLQATTSLEIALEILLSNSQPITIRNALAAYIQAADFSPDASSYACPDETVTAEDAILAFEHALDKHPLPVYATLSSSFATPKTKRKTTKTTKKTKTTRKSVTQTYSTTYADASTHQPFSYRRPFIDEIDKLRREYYTEKAENALKAVSSYPCSCGKCGDLALEAGGPVYNPYPGPTGANYGQCVGYEIAVEYGGGRNMRWDISARAERGMAETCGTEGCICETLQFGYGAEPRRVPRKTKRVKAKAKKGPVQASSPTLLEAPDPFGASTSAVTL